MIRDAAVMLLFPAAKSPRHHQHRFAAQESSRAAAEGAQKPLLPNPGCCGKQAEGSLPLLLSPVGQDEQGGCFQAAPELATMAAQAKG